MICLNNEDLEEISREAKGEEAGAKDWTEKFLWRKLAQAAEDVAVWKKHLKDQQENWI